MGFSLSISATLLDRVQLDLLFTSDCCPHAAAHLKVNQPRNAVARRELTLIRSMLRYADELRDPLDYLDEVSGEKPQKEMVGRVGRAQAKRGTKRSKSAPKAR